MGTSTVTLRAALACAESTLKRLAGDAARLEAEVLLAHLLGRSRTWLYAWPDHRLDSAQQQGFDRLVARRATGQPVAHLLGRREFWSLDLAVNEHTLIPRPATETLVEWALQCIAKRAQPAILDLGTGCGAIALALAAERPDAWILATDRYAGALSTAHGNASARQFNHVRFIQGDWLEPLARHARFDLIVSNPPYIADRDPHLEQGDVRFEPSSALCAGPDGLDDIRKLSGTAPALLDKGAWLLVEHGADQGPAVRALLQKASLFEVTTRTDLAGGERVTGGTRCKTLT